MPHSAESNFADEYLGEFETEFQNILGVNLGPRGNCLTKKPGVENLMTLSLLNRGTRSFEEGRSKQNRVVYTCARKQ
jgi:hypothetical protein